MKPLMFFLVTFGLLLGNANAQIYEPVVGVDKNELNEVDTCGRCTVLTGWGSEYSNECPSEANTLLRNGKLHDEQLLEENWIVSEFLSESVMSLDLLTFEFGDMSLSPEDIQKTYCLLAPGVQVERVVDINNDGISEIIITRMAGGAGSEWAYDLVALDESGRLNVHAFTEQYDPDGPKILRENNKTLIALDKVNSVSVFDPQIVVRRGNTWVALENVDARYGKTKLGERTFYYEFDGKELSISRWSEPPYLQAIKEAHVQQFFDFDDFGQKPIEVMTFDMNRDGNAESVICGYWSRWGVMTCDIHGENFSYRIPLGCKRWGILPTKTNQWHDLVCNYDTIIRFDGVGSYIE